MKLTFIPLLGASILLGAQAQAETIGQVCGIKNTTSCLAAQGYLEQPFLTEPTGFEAFKVCQQAEGDIYRLQTDCEFDIYLAQANAEFAAFKQEIQAIWGEARVTDKHNWIEYSPNLQLRRQVSFDRQQVEISLMGEIDNATAQATAHAQLAEIVSSSIGDATARDPYVNALLNAQGKTLSQVGFETPFDRLLAAGSQEQSQIHHIAARLASDLNNPRPMLGTGAKDSTRDYVQQASQAAKIQRHTTSSGETMTLVTLSFPNDWMVNRAREIKQLLTHPAQSTTLEPALELALIYNESSFNPLARSERPEFGLMQIEPTTIGYQVNAHMFGNSKVPAAEELYSEATNIRYGNGYFELLLKKYRFNRINDPQSRAYCLIAAYNGGPGAISQAITGKLPLIPALKQINTMTAEQVLETLVKRLPSDQTQQYLQKILAESQRFSTI